MSGFLILYLSEAVAKVDAERLVRYLTIAGKGKVGARYIGCLISILVKRVVGGKGYAAFLVPKVLSHRKAIAGP